VVRGSYDTVTLVHVAVSLCFSAQSLEYSVKNDVGLVVFDGPGKASGHNVAINFLFYFIYYHSGI